MAKIGLASVFAFRPHVEHLAYIENLLKMGGHEIVGFDCLSSVPCCYPRNLRGKSRLEECAKCVAGGIRSYAIPVTYSMSKRDAKSISPDRMRELSISSVATVFRTESLKDLENADVKEMQNQLTSSIEIAYGSALRWIKESNLDGVIFFNGRMDLTAGLMAACQDADIPFIATERAWLGDGILMVPNGNCLDISPISRLCGEYMDKPLLKYQIAWAGKIAADRYLRANKLEWRLYNANESRAIWPGKGGGKKVLIVPSSRNEFEGHPERMCNWSDYTYAMQEVLDRLGVEPDDVVVRCHPNWSEYIGQRTGRKSESHYTAWAQKHGYIIVPSRDSRSTYDLIEQSDIVIVNGSSSGVEAGILGKKIVSVGHCTYEAAGFSLQIHDDSQFDQLENLDALDKETIVLRTLRFIYLHGKRFSQFTSFIRADSTLHVKYYDGADPDRIANILESGYLRADDATYSDNPADEKETLQQVMNQDWGALSKFKERVSPGHEIAIEKRFGLKWIDKLRDKMTRGDLIR